MVPDISHGRMCKWLRFANEIEDAGLEWPNTDPEGWHYQLRVTMAAALEALIKAQAGKAVRERSNGVGNTRTRE